MFAKHRRLSLVLVGSAIGLSIALASPIQTLGPDADGSATSSIAHSLIEPITIHQALYAAHAIVRAEVLEVQDPLWNQESGEPWSQEIGVVAEPLQYRDVVIQVVEVLRGDFDVDPELTIAWIDGPTEPDAASGTPPGAFEEGDDVVLALTRGFFMMREGPVDRIYPTGDQYGVFHREDNGYRRTLTLPQPIEETAEFARFANIPIEMEDFRHLAEISRDVPKPEWDRLRESRTAAEQLAFIEDMTRAIREEAESLERDPNNVCNHLGDQRQATEWVTRNPDSGLSVNDLMDPSFEEEVCSGYEFKGAP